MAGSHPIFNDNGDVLDRSGAVIGVGENYAGIKLPDGAVSRTIDLVDLWHRFEGFTVDMPEKISNGAFGSHQITIGATGDYDVRFALAGSAAANNKIFEFHAFEIAAATVAITAVTEATPGVVTAVAHGRSNGDKVLIVGVVGMVELNGKIYTVANKADDTFELTDEEDVNVNTSGFTSWTSGGTVQLATAVDAHARRTFAVGADIGDCSGYTIAALTLNNLIQFFLRNETDAANFTVNDLNMSIKRVG